ncbi:Gfo/Idh/MocA family protein [Paenibacillaceae bacterium WGS1546]|uniref:Gfo/Idh/MocA family protein n=1 Tax=Cohnella sp. WGS1546 TaxID=3366810 RepID=UPI00372D183F
MRKVIAGVIGTGHISGIYLQNLTQTFDAIVEVKAVADLVPELAASRAAQFGIPHAWTVEQLLGDPEIEIVLNLTAPAAHAPINLKALNAGRHVYTEKPFALTREDADEVLRLAEAKGLLVGCAPDTFLGGGLQTCRKLIDEGWIGTPYSANGTIIMGNASGAMHPSFRNFLKLGGDPIMDMAPYYLTALVFLLGPVGRVAGTARQLHREITVVNPKSPAYGEKVEIDAPTNVSAVLDFASGAVGSLQAAKESFGYLPRLEIFGTEGNLIVNDPNMFGGRIAIQTPNGETKEFPYSHGYTEDSRGIGLADMAYAIRLGRPHRASGELARHVLDISLGIFESSAEGKHVELTSSASQPAPLPLGLKYNRLDAGNDI